MSEYELSERAAEMIRVGGDGYLFARNHHGFEQITGRFQFDEERLALWSEAIAHRVAWCAERNITYVVLIVPEKHVVYDDLLPDGETVGAVRPVTQIADSLGPDERARFIYPAAALKQASAIRPAYYKTDSHWTSWGAYWGYRALMAGLAPFHQFDVIPEESLEHHNYSFIGDLGAYLDPEPIEHAIDTSYPDMLRSQFFFSNVENIRGFRGQVHIFLNNDKTLPRAVMFRDSGANALFPFLNVHFSRMVAVAMPQFDADVIESEKPDIVITEMAERFLRDHGPEPFNGPHDRGIYRMFSETCQLPLPLPVDRSIFKLSFRFEMDNLAPILCEGWFGLGTRQIWSCGPRSVIRLPDLPRENMHLRLDLMPLHNAQGPVPQRLDLRAEGGETVHYVFNSGRIIDYDIPAAAVAADGSVTLVLDHPDGVVPAHAPHEPDLSFIILALWVLPGRGEV
jgi:hypothetical protein